MATVPRPNQKPKNETLLRLGKTFAEIRRERRFSQEKLALEAEINRTSINRMEAGKMNSSVLLLTKLCKTLRVSVADVFFRAKI